MTYRGVRSWPPVWIWIGGEENLRPRGEVGFLKQVSQAETLKSKRTLMIINYLGGMYMGCLIVEDPAFCREIQALLRAHLGKNIAAIGRLDVTHLL
jgi:hypothetical protein